MKEILCILTKKKFSYQITIFEEIKGNWQNINKDNIVKILSQVSYL